MLCSRLEIYFYQLLELDGYCHRVCDIFTFSTHDEYGFKEEFGSRDLLLLIFRTWWILHYNKSYISHFMHITSIFEKRNFGLEIYSFQLEESDKY